MAQTTNLYKHHVHARGITLPDLQFTSKINVQFCTWGSAIYVKGTIAFTYYDSLQCAIGMSITVGLPLQSRNLYLRQVISLPGIFLEK